MRDVYRLNGRQQVNREPESQLTNLSATDFDLEYVKYLHYFHLLLESRNNEVC